ncbi:MAG: response regulator [Sphingomonadales bacterium]
MSKVLLVDDDEGIRLIGQRALEGIGLEVYLAANAKEGLDLFSKNKVSLVITDLKVPGQTGLSLVLDIRKINPDQPILVISGGDLEAEWFLRAAREAGGVRALSKPFEIEALIKEVSSLLDGN